MRHSGLGIVAVLAVTVAAPAHAQLPGVLVGLAVWGLRRRPSA